MRRTHEHPCLRCCRTADTRSTRSATARRWRRRAVKKNYAKVGSSRPSALLYTYGPGAIMDLPQFTIMPAGLDDWERIWSRRDGIPTIHAPRLLDVVRMRLGPQVNELRPFPSQPKTLSLSREGDDLGVPARVFPQWLRCSGCDMLGPLSKFDFQNTHPYRPDLARFEHVNCPGRGGRGKSKRSPAVAARYLLVCTAGHVDEFPYDLWVHHGQKCEKAELPVLKMVDRTGGKGSSATIMCSSCGLRRGMSEAQGEAGRKKLPACRGRHPHLGAFEAGGCGLDTRLMLIGASNLWFGVSQAIIVMPQSPAEAAANLADRVRVALGSDIGMYATSPEFARHFLAGKVTEVAAMSDSEIVALIAEAMKPPQTEEERLEQLHHWDPVDLLVPEWQYLQRDPIGQHHDDPSGLMLSPRARSADLPPQITRVLAVDKLRKVNAFVGFTRVDALDRLNDDDSSARLAPLTRDKRPRWTVATEDRGEGVFLQLDEAAVAQWETKVLADPVWEAHQAGSQAELRAAVLRDRLQCGPQLPVRTPAVLAAAHLRARPDPRDGDALRLLGRIAQRTDLLVARVRGPGTRGRADDHHHGIGQRRHARRTRAAQ